MKKQLLLLLAVLLGTLSFAQVNKNEEQLALDLVRAHSKTIGLSDNDLNNLVVSSTYQTIADGIRMVYLQQTYQRIPIFNQMQVLAFKNGKLVSASGLRIANAEQVVNNNSATPGIAASAAVRAAIIDRKIDVPLQITAIEQIGAKTYFGNLGISTGNVAAELVWLPVSAKDIRLCWQVELPYLKTADHWLVRVDAATGNVLDKNNLTVFEQLPQPSAQKDPLQGTGLENYGNASTNQDVENNSPLVVNSATYRVIPYPAESPIHTGGTPATVTDPWTIAPGNATSLKWHYDGTTYFDSTRGNNVWAQEDRDNNNTTFGKTALSTTAQPSLTMNYTPDFAQAPTVTVNQQFATTNLFYWNNLVHDMTYLYGFDEPSGNFQANNQGRGGTGNDYVIADAQDAGGTNNANFSTPVDGSRPRMQMYLFTSTTPNRDGDLDNGVIVHEYGHGLSNRLTGGPANSSCLSNAEQGGEGWSDYLALMMTTNWATAQVTDGALSRPMGTYVLGQATTGAGIRNHPYSTNMAINPWTYADLAGSGGEVHVIGEIWCTALWEMTWEMINQDGINPNLFNPAGTGGNTAAMKLVIEGMRLQPCSPGYIDARNAILKADTLFYGAKYSCSIWKAFAKRGMGQGASQGSSNSTTDQVASFLNATAPTLLLTQNVTAQQEGLNITYTNKVTAGNCGAVSNYLLTDTLPANVTYVSGGTYNSANRVVSFPVNLAQGASQNYVFTVQINPGSYFPPVTLLDEQVTGTAGTIPAAWTAASTTTSVWTTQNTVSHSSPNAFFTPNRTTVSDQTLATTNTVALGATPPNLSFWHWYNSEPGWDGGVVEISTNGGTTWTDLGSRMTSNGYNGSLGTSTSALSGRSAFNGNSTTFIKTIVDLSAFANQSAKFRFRFASDGSVAATGWYVDDILLQQLALVNMRTSLFNNSGVRIAFSDTVTSILPSACVTGAFTSNPSNATVCQTANASFSVTATGTSLSYQWQVSTDGGNTYNNITGETGTSLQLNNVTTGMNNNRYRCQITGTCTSATNSTAGILTVNALPLAPGAGNNSRCGTGTVTITAAPQAGETIDWYANASGGSALTTGSTSFTTPSISATTTYYAEARNTATGCISATRTAVTATVNSIPAVPSGTGNARCGTGTVSISASAAIGETIDWYAAASGGTALTTGSASFTTPSISITTTYFAEARNGTTGCISATRTAVVATINAIPAAPAGNNNDRCDAGSISISATPASGQTIDWYTTASGGTAIQTGTNSLFVTISSTTTYYAEARNTITGCISATRTPVTATIKLSSSSTTHISICETALPYVWNNTSFSEGGVYTVPLVNAAGCDSLAQLFLDVAAAIHAQNVTGGGSYTVGGAGVPVGLSGSENGVNYQLLLNGNPVGAPVAGTNAAISFGNQLQAGVYTVNAYTTLCTQLMTGSATVTILSGPPAAFNVTGGGTYCSGGAGLSVGLSGSETGVNYQLKRSNGTINVGSPVAGTGAALDFGLQTVAADYTVLATNTTSLLTQQMLNAVTVRIATARTPTTPGAITGSADACPYMGVSNVTYTIRQAANATSYLWTAPAGATIIGSNTDTAVVIQYPTSFVSGTLSVVSVNACFANATSAARSLSITRKVPSTPGTITSTLSNPCTIVGTGGTVTYTIRQVTYATGYTWTLPAGMNFVSNYGDTGVVVTLNAGFTTGVISVVAYNNCATSTARSLTITAKAPSAPAAISGLTNVCAFIGQPTTSTYFIAPVAGATSYLWTAPANSTIVSGQGTETVELSFNGAFVTGTLTVKSVAACGTSSARSLALTKNVARPGAITASATPCPSTSVTYSIAAVPFATSYLWTAPANASITAGQGTTSVTISYSAGFVSGSVSVKSVSNCNTSTAITLAVAATDCTPFAGKGTQVPVTMDVQPTGAYIYPNPNDGNFNLTVKTINTNSNVKVQIVDMYGKVVKEQQLSVGSNGEAITKIYAAHLAAGIYEVRYASGKAMVSKKLVIVK